MSQLFLIALRNLAQHSKRTLLLGGAIAGVTALLTLLLCLSSGMHATMLESATTLSTGHINVAGFYKVTAGQSAPLVTQYQKVEEVIRKALPDIDFIAPRGRGWAKLVSDTGSMQAVIGGLEINKEPGFKKVLRIVQGDINNLSKPNSILIFEEQAKKLDVKLGDSLVISSQTARGVSNTIDVRVAAIAQNIGILSSFNVFVQASSLSQLDQTNADATGALHVYVKDMEKIPHDMDILRKALADAGYLLMEPQATPYWQKFESVNREDWTGQKIDLTTWEDEMGFFKWTSAAIDGLMYVLTVVLLIIISIGIMNSMWIAIRERTREIGTLRAIGMQRRRVLAMFMIEAFSLGVLGTLAGAFIGLILVGVLNIFHLHVPEGAQMFLLSDTLKLTVEVSRIFKGMSVITLCTTVISIIPSIHAARLKPITAMQHIG